MVLIDRDDVYRGYGCLSHWVTVASVTCSPRAGNGIGVAVCSAIVIRWSAPRCADEVERGTHDAVGVDAVVAVDVIE